MLRMPTKYVQSTLALSLTSSSQSRQRPVNVSQLSQKFSCFSALDLELGIPHCRFCTLNTSECTTTASSHPIKNFLTALFQDTHSFDLLILNFGRDILCFLPILLSVNLKLSQGSIWPKEWYNTLLYCQLIHGHCTLTKMTDTGIWKGVLFNTTQVLPDCAMI